MATLSEYFDTEARIWLTQLERGVAESPRPDAAELQRAARALRGTAQMAREQRVYRAVSAFEAAVRAVAASTLVWSDDVAQRARDSVADLRVLIERAAADDELDARVAGAVERWSSLGLPLPDLVTGAAPTAAPADDGRGEFREFAAREVAAIADVLDRGVQQLAEDPMDRESLRTILRRQRALLGAARLDEIPVVAEILRAVEDLTRVIAKLDIGVKQEWLDIFRVAREGLKASIEPLQRDQDPPASHALSRLRHMREELLERYGAGEAVSAAHETPGLVQATPVDEPPAPVQLRQQQDDDDGPDLLAAAAGAVERAASAAQPLAATAAAGAAAAVGAAADAAAAAADALTSADDTDVVPIERLCYTGDAALARALELRQVVARAATHDPQAREAVDELFDLIRIARG